MKKRFATKKKKKRISLKLFFFCVLFAFGMYISFQQLSTSKTKLGQKEFVAMLLKEGNHHQKSSSNIFTWLLNIVIPKEKLTPVGLLSENYQDLAVEKQKEIIKTTTSEQQATLEPSIYIYNTHQTEEYASTNFAEYSVKPTVQMNNYILEDTFTKAGKKVLVEENSIKQVLNQNGWKYAASYKASRILMEQAKLNNPSLKYFIDVHRDSLNKEKTTLVLNEKSYAKILFIVGMENPSYEKNLEFTTNINNKINEKYPGLTKGIYKKEGAGVNGIYNQDFSPYTILVEMGGPENTVDEVLNTSLAFAECFLEVINTNES